MIKRTSRTFYLGVVGVALVACGLSACGAPAAPLTQPSPAATPSDGVEQTLEELPVPEPSEDGTLATFVPPLAEPAPEDCVSYDPSNLTVTASGDAWLLREGSHAMKLFDTQADAEDGRRVARNWTKLCFIGRDNDEPDRYRYIVHYFKDPSGLPLGPAPITMECITYNPGDLAIYSGPAHPADPENEDWALHSGATPLLFLASEPDALRAEIVASGNTRLCVIGHGNDRPDPNRYRLFWWRQ
jgi:hypothetical protein